MNSKKVQAVIDKINQNQKLIKGFGVWDAGIRKKINYKIRLDWNYYSNRMEGRTLTQDETRSIMVGNIDVKGKPIKDVIEMKGHDDVVLDLLKIGQSEKRLSEKRIRDIHRSIMYEETTTEKEKVGTWKTQANMIYNYKNE
jgi:Fic family protein